MTKAVIFTCFIYYFLMVSAFAQSHQFRVINNSSKPIKIDISSQTDNWHKPGSITFANKTSSFAEFEVSPNSNSNIVTINTGKKHAYSISKRNMGEITISGEGETCHLRYRYDSVLSSLSYFQKRSLKFSSPLCTSGYLTNAISVVNDNIEARPRSLTRDPFINIDKLKASQLANSLALSDCGGDVNNCLIISPQKPVDTNTENSTQRHSLNIQAQISEAEPLSFEQFIGSHNAAISSIYTTSKNHYNMSYSDPNQHISITDMLNNGIRQIEIDTVWYNGSVRVCHNHGPSGINFITCAGNIPLTGDDSNKRYPFNEVKHWIIRHPNDFIILYFDINQSLAQHMREFNSALATLASYVYTPSMARKDYYTSGNELPMHASAREIIRRYKKNIIMVVDPAAYLSNNPYLFSFNNVKRSTQSATVLLNSCTTNDKYSTTNKLIGNRNNRWFRVDSDRVVFDYMQNKNYTSSDKYHNAFTTTNLRQLVYCPINIFSGEMWGYTCNSSTCDQNPSDPRFANLLWSWQAGYPLNTGSDIAVIDHLSHHFVNDGVKPDYLYGILCLKNSTSISPTAPYQGLKWYLVHSKMTPFRTMSSSSIAWHAQSLCSASGGHFVAPTTSYWMNDVLNIDNSNDIIVNYRQIHDHWMPNDGNSIFYQYPPIVAE